MFKALFEKRALNKAFRQVEASDLAGLRESLAKGVSPNAERNYEGTEYRQSLLLCAVERGAYPRMECLLEHGANPNQFNQPGVSPFQWAMDDMRRVISNQRLDFTAELPYETHPALTAVVQLFVAGGDVYYRPAGFQAPVVLSVAGPSREFTRFKETIDAWLDHQGARYQGVRVDLGTASAGPTQRAQPRL